MRVLGEYKYTKPAVSPARLLSLHETGGEGTGRKSMQTCRFGRAASLGAWQTVPDATLKALDSSLYLSHCRREAAAAD